MDSVLARVFFSRADKRILGLGLLSASATAAFFLHMPDIDSGHLANILEFIYRGRCQVKQEMFEEFLNCGKALGIEHLVGYLQNSNSNYDITQQQQTPTNTFTELSEENNENESKKAPLDKGSIQKKTSIKRSG